MSHKGRLLVGALVLGISSVALAAASPLLFSGSLDANGTLTVVTDRLPKGWFSSKNVLDRKKTNLAVSYALAATSCSTASTLPGSSSVFDGTFTPIYNPPETTAVGYTWEFTKDLSSAQNHWWYHRHCDGTMEVHGCIDSIAVTVGMTALEPSGACRTFVNDAGQTVCASDSHSYQLAAVQDQTVEETNCEVAGPDCNLGPIQSACEASCPKGRNGNITGACASKCLCESKAKLPLACPQYKACTNDE
jgi:hypothetical protein